MNASICCRVARRLPKPHLAWRSQVRFQSRLPRVTPSSTRSDLYRDHQRASSRRTTLLYAGALTCMATLWILATTEDIRHNDSPGSDPALEKLTTHVVIQKLGETDEIEKVPTGTSTIPHFPKKIHLKDEPGPGTTEYQLVGLGVRTVSFLSIEVYVVGMYIALDDVQALQSALLSQIDPIATTATEPEREKLKEWLLSGSDSEKVWNDVLKFTKMRTMFKIVPTRNTDLGHMRDGFVRGIGAKSSAHGTERENFGDDVFAKGMTDFKGLLGGKRQLKKGQTMLLIRDSNGQLEVRTDEVLGKVDDERLSRLLWLNYLAGQKVASEKARKNIVDGVMSFVERPMGTVEVKVE